MFKKYLRAKGITQQNLADYLGICLPTAGKYCNHPDTMQGRTRREVAKWRRLGLTIEQLDDMINGRNREESQKLLKSVLTTKEEKQLH